MSKPQKEKQICFGEKVKIVASLIVHIKKMNGLRETRAASEFSKLNLEEEEKIAYFENGIRIFHEDSDELFEITVRDKNGSLEPRFFDKDYTAHFGSVHAITITVKNTQTNHSHAIRIWRSLEKGRKIINMNRTYRSYQGNLNGVFSDSLQKALSSRRK